MQQTLCAGHGDSSGSFEYLVFRSILEGVARDHGFTPITDLQDPKLDRLFQQVAHKFEELTLSPPLPSSWLSETLCWQALNPRGKAYYMLHYMSRLLTLQSPQIFPEQTR